MLSLLSVNLRVRFTNPNLSSLNFKPSQSPRLHLPLDVLGSQSTTLYDDSVITGN